MGGKKSAGSVVKIMPADSGDPGSIPGAGTPEEGMATYFSFLAWEIPWTKESGRLRSVVSQRVGRD